MHLPAIGTRATVTIATTERQWQFPVVQFVVYEPSDEAWARPLGFGREVEVKCERHFPNAVITGVGRETLSFRAMPTSGHWQPEGRQCS